MELVRSSSPPQMLMSNQDPLRDTARKPPKMTTESNMLTVHENLQDSLQETREASVERRSGHIPPIFVVGVWRSGTTLLYSLLNQHRDIRLFYESDLPVLWPMFKLPWERNAWREKWEYWNSGLSRHDLEPSALEGPANSLAEAMERAGREFAAQKGKTRWGCKSPSYYDRMDFLFKEFPDARFIVIWRDPEEVCLSVIKARATALWFTRPGMTHKAVLAARTLKTQTDKLIRMGAFVHQLHFKDLLQHTDSTMRAICNFLEVPFDPAMTVLDRADRTAVYEGGHHKLAMGDKIVARKEKKETLPPDLTEKVARYKALWKSQWGDEWMLSARFGEPTSVPPGPWSRFKGQIAYQLLRAWDIVPRIVFSLLPVSAWQTYRRLKYKDAEWVHQQMTSKESKFPVKTELKKNSEIVPGGCEVRLGKLALRSMEMETLLSTDTDQLKHVVTVHAEIFTYAHENPVFEEVLKHTVNTIDGRVIWQVCSLIYPGWPLRKMSGSDFIYNLADHAAKHGDRVFLLGAESEANRLSAEILKTKFPTLIVEGYSPPFTRNIQDQGWNQEILGRVADFRPAHLVVCFGPPKQEMWIAQNADLLFHMGVRCAYGLGGTLDFVSGQKKRAPLWTQKIGFEWLYRLITEKGRGKRTAKMFKMPYFAFRYYKREAQPLSSR